MKKNIKEVLLEYLTIKILLFDEVLATTLYLTLFFY